MTRIVAIADLHGHLGFSLPDGDVLCIVGDIVPLYSSAEDQKPEQEMRWFDTKFRMWLRRESNNFDHIVITPGNHDCLFEHPTSFRIAHDASLDMGMTPTWTPRDGRGSITTPVPMIEVADVKFAAYNLSPTINQRPWPFSVARGCDRQVREEAVVTNAYTGSYPDVLLAHSPPAGLLDENSKGDHCGCASVSRIMHELMPKFSVHGHIHEERGNRDRVYAANGREIRLINCSLMDRTYSPKGGKPQVFDV